MKATEELRNEHKGIELMLKVLETVARRIESGKRIPAADLDSICEFFTVFVDACHHGKEETILFPRIEKSGISLSDSTTQVALDDHIEGRRLVKKLKACFEDYKVGKPGASQSVASSSKAVVSLFERHIKLEDNIIFPMASEAMSVGMDDSLLLEFVKFEAEKLGPGRHDGFHNMLKRLKDAYPQQVKEKTTRIKRP